ncbi:hypothetical protein EV356DRAFT_509401 [Viridothelium virens]|uniref:Uncharacterized protein n=1 Tax=Viridothelium virens TaxID=1048519 RepID=A0A6A6GWM2_VIRVR|nr:hypothetical protein EV356DRAFT_509401 [Viridothelium virens]
MNVSFEEWCHRQLLPIEVQCPSVGFPGMSFMAPVSRWNPPPPFVQLESIKFGQLLYETHIKGTFAISSLVVNFPNMVNNEGYPLPQQYPFGRPYLRYDANKKLHVRFMGVYGLYGEKAFATEYKSLTMPGYYPLKGTDNWPWCTLNAL